MNEPAQRIAPGRSFGALAFSLPYLTLWIASLFFDMRVSSAIVNNAAHPAFNFFTNAAQFLPLALVSAIFGRYLARVMPTSRGAFFKRGAFMAVCFAGYEVALVISVLLLSQSLFHLKNIFPPLFWLAMPAVSFTVMSVLFGVLHAVSGLSLWIWYLFLP